MPSVTTSEAPARPQRRVAAIAKWAGPPLTTIRVPLATMAEQATHLVTRLRDEPELAFSRVELATSLVVRESTAALEG